MITFPNAKINLGLNIVERRPDGYHNIETVFYPIPLTDALEIVPATGHDTSLTCYGRNVDCPPEKNLVTKAYRLMHSRYDLPPVDIHLYKHIPDGAGLGGGSSDAAHTLIMLNDMFSLNIDKHELADMAATLGADCPFFIFNRPMTATGIGDRLTPIDITLAGTTMLLVKPQVSVSTAAAYAGITPRQPQQHVHDLIKAPMSQWKDNLVNDFEHTVFRQFPQLEHIKLALIEAGATYAAMSGSGSALFGIFETDNMADKVKLDCDNCDIFILKL